MPFEQRTGRGWLACGIAPFNHLLCRNAGVSLSLWERTVSGTLLSDALLREFGGCCRIMASALASLDASNRNLAAEPHSRQSRMDFEALVGWARRWLALQGNGKIVGKKRNALQTVFPNNLSQGSRLINPLR